MQRWGGTSTWKVTRQLLSAPRHNWFLRILPPDWPEWRWEVRLSRVILVQMGLQWQEGPPHGVLQTARCQYRPGGNRGSPEMETVDSVLGYLYVSFLCVVFIREH